MTKRSFIKAFVFVCATEICLFANPAASNAAGAVLINEIAWMGTAAESVGSSDEWIELYNSSQSEIDLVGWGIYEIGCESPGLITSLTKKISSGGYYLIERSEDDNTISDIIADDAKAFKCGGLSNEGETLELRDSSGAVIDSVAKISTGWLAGDKDSKSTMERKSDGGWKTNDRITRNGHDANGGTINGTPRSVNSVGISSSTSTPQSDSQTALSGSSGSSSLSETKILKAEAGPDIFIERGKPISLSGISSVGAESYKWYLGDGAAKDGAEITYTYQFPGTYLVTLEVSSGGKTDIDQSRVFVFGGKAIINEFFPGNSSTTGAVSDADGGWVEIYNSNSESLDMSGWILSAGDKNFIVPPFVIIPKGGFLVFSQKSTGLDITSAGKISVKYPNGLAADEVSFEKNVVGSSANRTSDGFFWSKETTPGRQNVVLPSGGAFSDLPQAKKNIVEIKPNETAKNHIASFYSLVENPKDQVSEVSVSGFSGGFVKKLFGNAMFWIISVVVLGLFSSIFYFRLAKKSNYKPDEKSSDF